MPKLSREDALKTLWRAERQEWDRLGWMLYQTEAPEDVWNCYYAREPSGNFNVWLRQYHQRKDN